MFVSWFGWPKMNCWKSANSAMVFQTMAESIGGFGGPGFGFAHHTFHWKQLGLASSWLRTSGLRNTLPGEAKTWLSSCQGGQFKPSDVAMAMEFF